MKQTLLALFLLAAIAGEGQILDKMDTLQTWGRAESRWGMVEGYRGGSLTFWLTPNAKASKYHSGEIEVRGDTLAILRDMSFKIDSMRNRLYKSFEWTETLLFAGINSVRGHPQFDSCMNLLREWRAFKEGRAWPVVKSGRRKRGKYPIK